MTLCIRNQRTVETGKEILTELLWDAYGFPPVPLLSLSSRSLRRRKARRKAQRRGHLILQVPLYQQHLQQLAEMFYKKISESFWEFQIYRDHARQRTKTGKMRLKFFLASLNHKKFQRLANSWKNRTLNRLRIFIDQTAEADKRSRKLDKPSTCQSWFEQRYSVDNFVNIFDFCNKYININRSSNLMAPVIWIDLGTCLKMEWNLSNKIENHEMKGIPYGTGFTHARYHQYGKAAAYVLQNGACY
ncbi:hypothetical protein TrVGV298_008554 [Trichoderma virens]|nr:hypothetical protein TrVGV298_008554 [Trichoderma virens]